MKIELKQIYLPCCEEDGERYLVDRLWPRGMSKAKAHLAGWPKFLTPSTQLRVWYHEDRSRWPLFRLRYLVELEEITDLADEFLRSVEAETISLVYASSSKKNLHAAILKQFLKARLDE